MTTRRQVDFLHAIQRMGWKPTSHSYEVRPETAMDVRDPASRERASQYGSGVLNRFGDLVNFVALGMPPPTTPNAFAGDPLC